LLHRGGLQRLASEGRTPTGPLCYCSGYLLFARPEAAANASNAHLL
jgi:hypothetical protein